ncbi:MAG: D-alanyl-D-alanine carboxypeptidase family protein [Acidimicrobiia bacterium]
MRRIRSRAALVATVAATLVAGLVSPAVAKDTSTNDARAKRDQIRRQEAATAAKIDALKSDSKQVSKALATLDANVAAEQAALKGAQADVDTADATAKKAKAQIDQLSSRVTALEVGLKQAALSTYTGSASFGSLTLLSAGDATEAIRRQTLSAAVAGDVTNITDQLSAARQDLGFAERTARSALDAAAAKRNEVKSRVDELAKARSQQEALADQLEERLNRSLSESASLATQDKALTATIAAQEKAIADQLAKQARERSTTKAPTPIGQVTLQTVRGITVAASIADKLDAMLAAAERAGIHLKGSGYRSSAGQIESRKQSCGTSNYDIYQKPASQCRPPVAIPGSSMHEQGLAIDFNTGGDLIRSRSSAEFKWLSANAARYGFYNYPVEPWHWSVNGH